MSSTRWAYSACLAVIFSISLLVATVRADSDVEVIRDKPEREYRLVKPIKLQSDKTYPLLIALHGYDGTAESFARLFSWQPDSKDWYIVAPQAVLRQQGQRKAATWKTAQDLAYLCDLVDRLVASMPIDKSRVAVAGYSAGASFALMWATREPDRFAAVGLIAGGGADGNARLDGLAGKHVFLLGAQKDRHLSEARIRTLADALRKAGAVVKWEVLEGTDHASIYNRGGQVGQWIFQAVP